MKESSTIPEHNHEPFDTRGPLAWVLLFNGAFFLVELAVGVWTGSLALLSDAVHMAGDVASLLLALGAAQLARRPAGRHQTFGLRRAEVIGGFVNGLAMLLAVVWIAREAVGRLLFAVPEVPGLPILAAGTVGLAVNLGSAAVLYRQSHHGDLNIRGALLHMLGDALGSAGAIVAALFVLWGYPAADAIVSLGIAVLVLWATASLLRDSGRVLFQLPPSKFDVDQLQGVLGSTDGVTDVHDVHVWSLDGVEPIVTAHLVTEGDMDAVRKDAIERLRKRLHVRHATLQVERLGTCSPCHLVRVVRDPHPRTHTHG